MNMKLECDLSGIRKCMMSGLSLLLAGGFALAGSVVSFSRLSLALPQGLTRSKGKA